MAEHGLHHQIRLMHAKLRTLLMVPLRYSATTCLEIQDRLRWIERHTDRQSDRQKDTEHTETHRHRPHEVPPIEVVTFHTVLHFIKLCVV